MGTSEKKLANEKAMQMKQASAMRAARMLASAMEKGDVVVRNGPAPISRSLRALG